MDIIYRPVNALNISLSPSYGVNHNHMQYVTTGSANDENRYVVALIDQTTIRMSIRVTYMVTPNLSIQYYGQPFGTSGNYSNFKVITDGTASSYGERFQPVSPNQLTLTDKTYHVDENGDGMMDYDFSNPNFNFGQFRSNTVIRWEYIPGSVLFLVWNQEKNGAFYDDDPDHSKYSFQFKQKAYNIFALKFAYRFRR